MPRTLSLQDVRIFSAQRGLSSHEEQSSSPARRPDVLSPDQILLRSTAAVAGSPLPDPHRTASNGRKDNRGPRRLSTMDRDELLEFARNFAAAQARVADRDAREWESRAGEDSLSRGREWSRERSGERGRDCNASWRSRSMDPGVRVRDAPQIYPDVCTSLRDLPRQPPRAETPPRHGASGEWVT